MLCCSKYGGSPAFPISGDRRQLRNSPESQEPLPDNFRGNQPYCSD